MHGLFFCLLKGGSVAKASSNLRIHVEDPEGAKLLGTRRYRLKPLPPLGYNEP